MNYKNAYKIYCDTIEDTLKRRALIRKTCLYLAAGKDRAKIEKSLGVYGSGSEKERKLVTDAMDKDIKYYMQWFSEINTIDDKGFSSCFFENMLENNLGEFLQSVKKHNSALGKKLEGLVFKFDDLPVLDDRACQRWLRKVDSKALAKALIKASPATTKKILKNMSERAAELLKKDVEKFKKQNVSDEEILEIQTAMGLLVSKMETTGEIVIARKGGKLC